MSDPIEDMRRIKRLTQWIVGNFETEDWEIISQRLPGGSVIENHPDMFRAMHFGDDSYGALVAEVINDLLQQDSNNLSNLERYTGIATSIASDGFNPHQSIFDNHKCFVFISHKAQEKNVATDLKNKLAYWGVSGFVAHEDIEVTSYWATEIENNLRTCDALVYISSPASNSSEWCQQEVGWALGRDIPVVAFCTGEEPKAFLGQRQACSLGRYSNAAMTVLNVLLADPRTCHAAVNGLIELLRGSMSYDSSNQIVKVLNNAVFISSEQANSLEACIANNDQVRDANHKQLPSQIRNLIQEKQKH